MKKSKFTETKMIFAIRQSELGVSEAEMCCKMGVSEITFYNWKKKYGGLGMANLNSENQMLQDVLRKKP